MFIPAGECIDIELYIQTVCPFINELPKNLKPPGKLASTNKTFHRKIYYYYRALAFWPFQAWNTAEDCCYLTAVQFIITCIQISHFLKRNLLV